MTRFRKGTDVPSQGPYASLIRTPSRAAGPELTFGAMIRRAERQRHPARSEASDPRRTASSSWDAVASVGSPAQGLKHAALTMAIPESGYGRLILMDEHQAPFRSSVRRQKSSSR